MGKYSDEIKEKIKLELLQDNCLLKDIAKKYNVSYSFVKSIKAKNNIKKNKKYNEDQIKQVIELLLEQKLPQEIQKLTGVSTCEIRKIKNKQSYLYLTENIEFPNGYKKICKNCGKEFIANHINSLYCCNDCKHEQTIKNHTRIINCKYCNKEFSTHYDNVKFCSTSCAAKYYVPIIGFGSKIRPKEVWNKGLKNCFNEETLIKKSNSMTNFIINGKKKQTFRGKGGYRKDLNNQYFRSTWEANIARILKFNNIKYEFEKHKYFLNSIQRYYVPDFYLPEKDLLIEVKGYWIDDAKDKFEIFKKEYPNKNILLIDRVLYKELEQKYLYFISEWEY